MEPEYRKQGASRANLRKSVLLVPRRTMLAITSACSLSGSQALYCDTISWQYWEMGSGDDFRQHCPNHPTSMAPWIMVRE